MALIICQDCSKEISSSALSCPGCGAPIAEAQAGNLKEGYIPYSAQEVAVMLSQKKRTSHLLHLILSILTIGFWIIVWLAVAWENSSQNSSIDKNIQKGKKLNNK